jgi:hypothetical protein
VVSHVPSLTMGSPEGVCLQCLRLFSYPFISRYPAYPRLRCAKPDTSFSRVQDCFTIWIDNTWDLETPVSSMQSYLLPRCLTPRLPVPTYCCFSTRVFVILLDICRSCDSRFPLFLAGSGPAAALRLQLPPLLVPVVSTIG